MLNCQISMRWGLKKKPNFSGLSVKGREVATPHQNTCEHASCKRHRANLECAGTRACQKVVVKSLTKMDFDRENSFFNPKIHFYRTSFSLIKTTGGNGSVLQILTCLWVLFFFFLSGPLLKLCEMLKPEKTFVHWWKLQKLDRKEYDDRLRSQIPSHLNSYQDRRALLCSPRWPQLLDLLSPPTATSPMLQFMYCPMAQLQSWLTIQGPGCKRTTRNQWVMPAICRFSATEPT